MSDKYPKSKLKRRKLYAEETRCEVFFKNNTSIESSSSTRSAVPAEAWWSRGDLSAVESLWAQTLSSALPCLEAHPWGPVPDLPTPSKLSAPADPLNEWRWCSLTEEVTPLPSHRAPPQSPPPMVPLPNTHPPSSPGMEQTLLHVPDQNKFTPKGPPLKSAPGPGGLGEGTSAVGSPILDARVPTGCGRGGPWREQEDRRGEVRRTVEGAKPGITAKRQGADVGSHPSCSHPSVIQTSSGVPPGARDGGSSLPPGESGREDENEKEMKRLRLPALRGEALSDRSTAAHMEASGKREEGVSGNGRADWDAGGGGGGGTLQRCPMCLLHFPAGFSQMDRDTHLAKCLSEMTVDITW
ncbi:hypothetical protein UPYG_G00004630 [Umbra pygmaea]|uniref:UBZ2-type domain-containing protein n=1 Tax=Umbra pygmaea TaxID=75934 RepID=A0ABD0XHE6_UMBPY